MSADVAGCSVRSAPQSLRVGLKGKAAAAVLSRRGFTVPDGPNQWNPCRFEHPGDGRLLRLGYGEYLLERDVQHPAAQARLPGTADWHGLVTDATPACHLVTREDSCHLLQGAHCESLLAEVCNVDFRALQADPQRVVLTLLAGVAVTVIREAPDTGHQAWRIWCDPSFGHYLGGVLRNVVVSSGAHLGNHSESNEDSP